MGKLWKAGKCIYVAIAANGSCETATRENIPKFVKFRHVGTRALGPTCLKRVPRD